MKIRIRAAGFQGAEELRAHVRRRIELVLTRFGDNVRSVDVVIPKAGHSPGDPARRCRLDLILCLEREICVEDVDPDPFIAVSRAVDRAARGVSRMVELDHLDGEGPTSRPSARRRKP